MAIPIPGYDICGEDDAAVDATAAPSEKTVRTFGAYVFFLLHGGNEIPDRSENCVDLLTTAGWNDWFCSVEAHPLAADQCLFLCEIFEIEPEAAS